MISIIDYGLGNVMAISNIYKKLNIPTKIVRKKEDLAYSSKIILPGVGSYDWAMKLLLKSDMTNTINNLVLIKKVPILGICVGMQIMTDSSEEGLLPGLGWIDGKVIKFSTEKKKDNFILPHMGWNNIKKMKNSNIFFEIDNDSSFYFLHSYYVELKDGNKELAKTDYFGKFTSVFQKENIYGVQFHPEKSHKNGIKLLENFSKLKSC